MHDPHGQRPRFPSNPLAALGVAVSRPDDYLCGLVDQHLDEVVAVVLEMAADRRRPTMTPTEVLDALARAGIPQVVALLGSVDF